MEQNTSYVQQLIRVRIARNSLKCLWDDQGNKIEDPEEIKGFAIDFYKNLLGTITMQFEEEKACMVSHLFTVKNSIAMVESLQRGFIDEEI